MSNSNILIFFRANVLRASVWEFGPNFKEGSTSVFKTAIKFEGAGEDALTVRHCCRVFYFSNRIKGKGRRASGLEWTADLQATVPQQ
jgi:hypothetical protein